jgi:hypothetical protein
MSSQQTRTKIEAHNKNGQSLRQTQEFENQQIDQIQ